jgi:hypothetical protein
VLLLLSPLFVTGIFSGTSFWIKVISLSASVIYLRHVLFVYLKRIIIQPGCIIIEYPLRIYKRNKLLKHNDITKLVKGTEKNIDVGEESTALVIYTKRKRYYIEKIDSNLIKESIELFYSQPSKF